MPRLHIKGAAGYEFDGGLPRSLFSCDLDPLQLQRRHIAERQYHPRRMSAMTASFHPSIGLRLIIALVALGTAGLGMAAVALWTFDRYGRAAEEIATTETRRLATVARFTEIATGVRAEMPRLVFAETEEEKVTARHKLDTGSEGLAMLVHRLQLPDLSAQDTEANAEFGVALSADIAAIDHNVSERIAIRDDVRARVRKLRQKHAHFQREIKPLLTNAAFNIQAALRRLGTPIEPLQAAPMTMVRQELAISDALSRLHAHVNLMLGKMLEAAAENRRVEIERIRFALEEAVETAAPLNEVLRDMPSAASVREASGDIESQVTREPRLIEVKLHETALAEEGLMFVARADKRLNDLADLVARTVLETNDVSLQAAQRAREAINRGTMLIFAFGGSTAALSVLVGWLYVGRRLIARLSALLVAMRGIASGDLETPIPIDGNDEMGQLADALRRLQMRSQLARERRLALAAANEQLSFEIAERRAAQDKLERTQQELVQAGKLAAIGQVSTGIAHEFNQPLAAMRSYIHNAGRYLENGNREKVAEKLDQMESLLSRMARISNHLKTMARRPSVNRERCRAGLVMERAAALFEAHVADGAARLTIVPYSSTSWVEAEPNRLEQVFINLLSNAFHAVEGRPNPEVIVRIANGPDMQRIFIADNGGGIAPSDREHLFDAFFTTKPPGAGLGLGLTIAYNIVQDFGGRLAIKNRRHGGAVAVVSLRIACTPDAREIPERLHAGQ